MNRSMKLFWAWTLTLALLFTCLPLFALPAGAEEPLNQCGDNVYSAFNEATGEVTVTGSGDMWPFDDDMCPVPWMRYRDKVKSVTVENGVTSIGGGAFFHCGSLTRVTLPDSLKEIADAAFSGCGSLTGVTIPDGVTRIGYSAFRDCGSLTKVSIPGGVERVNPNAFMNCTSLTDVTLSAGTTYIGQSAFDGCTSLKNVTLPDSITFIGQSAFEGCSGLEEMTIPASVTEINRQAFYGCSGLKKMTVLTKDCSIELASDYDADAIARILGVPGVTVIYGYSNSTAYTYAESFGYQFVSLDGGPGLDAPDPDDPGTVVPIEPPPSSGRCGDDLTWDFDEASGTLTIAGSGAMNDYSGFDFPAPWSVFKGSIKVIRLEKGVTSIGMEAFKDCAGLTDVTIPEGVTSIEDSAFSGCSSLTAVTVPEGVTGIGISAFYNCRSLADVTLPESLKAIGNSAFNNCISLTEVTVPKNVSAVEFYAFGDCSSLQRITILSRICWIGDELNTTPAGTLGDPGVAAVYGIRGTFAEAYAERCGHAFVEINGCDYGSHNYEILDEKVHTDSEAGWQELRCADCGKEETREIPAGHCYEELVLNHQPTGVFHCIYCDSSYETSSLQELLLNKQTKVDLSDGSVFLRFTPKETGTYSLASVPSCAIDAYLFDSDGKKLAEGYAGNEIDTELHLVGRLEAGQTYYYYITLEKGGDEMGKIYIDVKLTALDDRTGFVDVTKGAFYADAAAWAVEKKITNGTTVTTFSPDNTCTRGQVVTFLWRAAGSKAPTTTESPFVDVKNTKAAPFYYNAVLWAVENKVTSGIDKTHFGPDAGCTRGQVVTFLWRTAGCPEPKSTENPFTDVKGGAFYYKAVLWAVENNITNGMTKTTFAPDSTCTRGQIVTFLYRAMK